MIPIQLTTEPVVITPVRPTELHSVWPFLERGLSDIVCKIEPDWIPADVYGAIRAEVATAVIVTRAERRLGFGIWHKQERPWSHKLDIFVWAVWAIPLRERIPSDNLPEVMYRGIQYLYGVKAALGANAVIMVSSRKGFARHYGFKQRFITYEVLLNGSRGRIANSNISD